MDLYDVAREVTDSVMGEGTYAKMNVGNPDPGVQRAIGDESLYCSYWVCEKCGHFYARPEEPKHCENCGVQALLECDDVAESEDESARIIEGASAN